MQTVTLEDIKATRDTLVEKIAKFEAEAAQRSTFYTVGHVAIKLAAGERYAGLVLKPDGSPSHHVVLLPDKTDGLSWQAAIDWAGKVGGELPTRQEQALLYANLKAEFEARWHWSAEVYERDGSSAWYQYFNGGDQDYYPKYDELQARAVRRFPA